MHAGGIRSVSTDHINHPLFAAARISQGLLQILSKRPRNLKGHVSGPDSCPVSLDRVLASAGAADVIQVHARNFLCERSMTVDWIVYPNMETVEVRVVIHGF